MYKYGYCLILVLLLLCSNNEDNDSAGSMYGVLRGPEYGKGGKGAGVLEEREFL